jgi:hypothetical protein
MTKIQTILRIFFILSFIFTGKALSQSCEECQTRNLIIFDNNILVPRPTGPDSVMATAIPQWWNLFYITGGKISISGVTHQVNALLNYVMLSL